MLSDDDELTITYSRQSRAASRILNKESEESTSVALSYGRRMMPCDCSECKGNLVDIHTKMIHETKGNGDSDVNQDSEVVQEDTNPLPSLEDNLNESSDNDDETIIQRMEVEETDDLPAILPRQ